MRVVLNIAAFYAGWFGSVLAAANGWRWAAIVAGLAVVVVHLIIDERPQTELKLIAAAGLVGLLAEGLLMKLGFATYALPEANPAVPPVWLLALWMAFATTMNVSLGWLKDRLGLAAILGLAAAPPSYFAGEKLGGMQLAEPQLLSLAAIGLVWAVSFPLLVALARRWDGDR